MVTETADSEENMVFKQQESKASCTLRSCVENPWMWVINLAAAVLSWKYWDGLSTDPEAALANVIVIVDLVILLLSSAWFYYRGDQDVREFLAGEQIRTWFTTPAEIQAIERDPVKKNLYARSQLSKIQNSCVLAGIWTLTLLAIVLTGANSATQSGLYIRVMPIAGFVVASLFWLFMTLHLKRTQRASEAVWHSVVQQIPKSKRLPKRYIPSLILCASPEPLGCWDGEKYFICDIAKLYGRQMPEKDSEGRNKILWRYLEVNEMP
ncbi:hypothetical protein G7007_18505 [Pseudomonas entomophila]|uniref:hypothetical protein n=1 Tax=Pseudomonas entomophila TaxID=312306 RepID=UPI0015E48B66|nr:hypothetical protein [Pseudomonas entomophila]MBA1194826.1 hypothetical protein [Pseudomonas entomophila]